MNAEIITIGNELLSGTVTDTNASFLAGKALSMGVEVTRMVSVGDNERDIKDSLENALQRSDIIIVTGGLGPTPDDITAEVAAKTLQRELVVNDEALHWIKKLFSEHNLEMPRNNEKQALIPEGGTLIMNPIGTACGFLVREKGKLIFFLPGVPKEVVNMSNESVFPIIQIEVADGPQFETTTLKVFGLGESKIAELIKDIVNNDEYVMISFLPNYPENHIKITAKGMNREEAASRVEKTALNITERLGKHIFGRDNQTMEEVVGRMLSSHGHTIAVSESCTGGLISQRLTNVPGSSDYMIKGVVVTAFAVFGFMIDRRAVDLDFADIEIPLKIGHVIQGIPETELYKGKEGDLFCPG